MSITTKTGDGGLTSLLYGGRVKKDSLRVKACGALDELNSFLGLSKSLLRDKAIKSLINRVQKELFIIGSEVVSGTSFVHRLRKRIRKENVDDLELFMERLEKKGKPKGHAFVLPGKSTLSAALDVTRSIARRTERIIVTLKNKKMLKNKYILIYLNRLSDLLYLLARLPKRSKKDQLSNSRRTK